MSQRHKIELLVTERNCQEFGEDESPSKMAEKRDRERESLVLPHRHSALFCPRLEQGEQHGNVLASPHRKRLGVERAWRQTSSHREVPRGELGGCLSSGFGSCCSQGVKFKLRVNCSFLAKMSITSCAFQPLPSSLKENNSSHRSRALKKPT